VRISFASRIIAQGQMLSQMAKADVPRPCACLTLEREGTGAKAWLPRDTVRVPGSGQDRRMVD